MLTRGDITSPSGGFLRGPGSPMLYRLAADYIERYGWRRGEAFGDDGEAACVVGGIFQAARQLGVGGINAQPLLDFVQVDGLDALFRWNDAPERTAAEVVKTLRAFADHLEEQKR